MAEVSLLVNGVRYGGWTRVSVTRSLQAIAGSFSLEVSERWGGQQGQTVPWPIRPEDECAVMVDDQVLLTGYVDSRSQRITKDEHSFSVAGRDRTGDLVDCSAVLKTWEFARAHLLDVCTTLAEPFGIRVTLQEGLDDRAVSLRAAKAGGAPSAVGKAGESSSMRLSGPNAKVTVNPGDSPFEVIDRMCRLVGVLPVSDGHGNLVLTRSASAATTTSLVEGRNVLTAGVDWDQTKRYRRYIVSGQAAGSDTLFGSTAAAVTGEATDDQVARAARVLLVRPEGSVTPEFARQRAGWEATVRRARAVSVSVTVQGWQQENGQVWPINAVVPVTLPSLGIDGPLLIVEATTALSIEEGRTTTFTLADPQSFIPEPTIVKPVKGKGGSSLSELLGL